MSQHLLFSLGNSSNEVEFHLRSYGNIRLCFPALLAKLLGFVIWIITFIDFYPTASVGLRYFLCFFPNIGMLFCIQVLQQFERRSGTYHCFFSIEWDDSLIFSFFQGK